MTWTSEDIDRIKHLFPKPRGTVKINHLTFLQALQYIAENGCRWRALPYEGDAWRAKAVECGMIPVVPPKSNRVKPWRYSKKLYKQRYIVAGLLQIL